MLHLSQEQAKLLWDHAHNVSLFKPHFLIQVSVREVSTAASCGRQVTQVPSFGWQKYIHVSVDTFSGAVFASVHAGENVRFTKRHFLLAFAALGVPQEIKTDNGPAYKLTNANPFSRCGALNILQVSLIRPQVNQLWKGHTLPSRESFSSSREVQRQYLPFRGSVIDFLNCSSSEPNPSVIRHFSNLAQAKLDEKPPVLIKDPETHQVSSAFQLISWGRGYACVSTLSGPKWLPGRHVKPYFDNTPNNDDQVLSEQDIGPLKDQKSPAWRRSRCRLHSLQAAHPLQTRLQK